MLKTNSKQARANIRAYILEGVNDADFDINIDTMTFEDVATIIYNQFISQKWNGIEDYRYYTTEQNAFENWCSGLPSVLDTCYYYNRSAIDDLGMLLQESDSEKAKYTESQAEKLLTYLIYREIKRSVTQ